MKTAIVSLLVLAPVAFAQSPTSHIKIDTSLRELKKYEFRPMPVMIIDNDGVRTYSSQEEANRKEKERSDKQIALKKQIEQSNKVWQKQADERADKAMWKLVVFGIGLFIGFLRIVWSIAISK